MKLHHTGFIVENREKYITHLIYQEKIKEVFDPVQDAYLMLLRNFSDAFIELIQPVSEKSPTYNFLKKHGEGFHHFCYEISNQKQLDELVDNYKLIKVF